MFARLICCFLVLNLIGGAFTLGAEPIVLTSSSPRRIPVIPALEYIEDVTRTADLETIRTRPAGDWKKWSGDRLAFSPSASAYWIRFSIHNPGNQELRRYLEFQNVLHDYLDFFALYRGQVVEQRITGDRLPHATRGTSFRVFAFPVNIPAGDRLELYVRLASYDGIFELSRPVLSTDEALSARLASDALKHGIFAGILICAILYNIFVIGSAGQSASLAYNGYVVSMLLIQAIFFGYVFQLMIPDLPYWHNILLPLTQSFCGVALLLFTRSLLQTRRFLPWTDRLLLVIMIGWAVPGLLALAGYYTLMYTHFMPAFLPSAFLISMIAAIRRIRQGDRPARYFFLGVGLSSVGIFLFAFSGLGLIPDHPLFSDAINIGLTLEIVVFSRAIASRLKHLRLEKENAQRYIIEQKSRLLDAAARFVPTPFLNFLGKEDITAVELGDAVQADISVLFLDIRGFTTLSEGMQPDKNFRFLNRLYGGVAPIIREKKGFIDKFIGDAIMALFPEGPSTAVDAARAITVRLRQLNRTRAGEGKPPIRVGIGIHHGSTMLGTLGEAERMETTVISDAVNLASRLEALTSRYGVTILISADVFAELDPDTRAVCREIDSVLVKGKTQAVTVYDVMA